MISGRCPRLEIGCAFSAKANSIESDSGFYSPVSHFNPSITSSAAQYQFFELARTRLPRRNPNAKAGALALLRCDAVAAAVWAAPVMRDTRTDLKGQCPLRQPRNLFRPRGKVKGSRVELHSQPSYYQKILRLPERRRGYLHFLLAKCEESILNGAQFA
jgi:hypothetical protein